MGSEQVTAGPESRSHLKELLAIGAVASAIGIALGIAIDWFPTQATEQGEKIDTLWDVLIFCSVPFFVLVSVVVLYSVWRFRMRAGEEEKDGPPIHGNTRLEIIWTAIPAVLLVALCSYAYLVLRDVEEADARALRVRVVGEQFTWTFYYRDAKGKEFASPQLYVPQGRQVAFTVQSKDVIHDFWVPAFRVKIDAVRGIDTALNATPKTIGRYPIVCAELCGIGHAAMRQTAHVVSPRDFDAWVRDRAAGAGPAAGKGNPSPGATQTESVDGRAVFTANNCGSCHVLSDAGGNGAVGPNLDEALQDKNETYIRQSIVAPNAEIEEGYQPGLMPPNYEQTIQPAELDALVGYLAKVAR